MIDIAILLILCFTAFVGIRLVYLGFTETLKSREMFKEFWSEMAEIFWIRNKRGE